MATTKWRGNAPVASFSRSSFPPADAFYESVQEDVQALHSVQRAALAAAALRLRPARGQVGAGHGRVSQTRQPGPERGRDADPRAAGQQHPKFLADDLPLFHAIHAANGSLLDDAHGRVRHEARRGPRGSRGNGKDREQQGPGQGHGHPVRRVQLQRPDRLQEDGEALPRAGNWTCLDEFNRFDIEVLSVVAQQLLILREGLIQGKEHINFMGIEILLKDHHSS
ncbi:hypothetical protein V7S43_006049 [Phytophthora oleae]|uniref:Dynein heavy chain hydrolytic ATP-binding dynein motor region domain-containing protein n=1 Tax=Phytophthora oleae TaxID=2107226 RepID=A0ABD3FT02_9STRA